MAYFNDKELACHCGCGLLPTPGFRARLEQLRANFGKPMIVSSGARCPIYNATVSTTGATGPHTKDACDFALSGAEALRLLRIAIAMGFRGIGIHQKGSHNKRFIHVDELPNEEGQPRPTIWSY